MLNLINTLLVFLYGAAIGSFLNVVIVRYLSQRSLLGRSLCPQCRRQLRWWELIPILSFIVLLGHCRTCRKEISLQYPLVEFAMGLSALILFTPLPTTASATLAALLAASIVALLLILFVIDLYTFLLPDIFIGLLAITVVLFILVNYKLQTNPWDTLWGILIGSSFLFFLWLITHGHGIGLGDVKLMLPLGALFGPSITVIVLFLAFISGGLIAITLLISGRAAMKTPVPFGPFLAGAAILIILAPALPATIITWLMG